MLGIWNDLVFAARVLRRSRGFTIIAASSLALAIGANTTIFSVGKQLLFDRLDVPDASSLRLLATTDFSYPVYRHLREQNTVLGDLLAFHATAANATVGDNAERVLLHEVSGNYYEVLGVRAQIGREIRPSDDMPGSPAVAMISDAFWAREFARSPAAIGKSITINDIPITIVGVNPRGFTGAGSTLPSATPAVIVTLAKATLVTPASNGQNWLPNPAARRPTLPRPPQTRVSERPAPTALHAPIANTFPATRTTRARVCRTTRHRAIQAALRLAGFWVYRGDDDRHRPALRVRAGVRGLAHGDRRQRQATPRRWTIGRRISDRAGDASGDRRRALH